MQLLAAEGSLPERKVKIGLLPGSFNPPHAGHIDLAVCAARAGLDRILFYANSFNIPKRQHFVPISHRREMLGLMIDPSTMSVLPGEFYPDAPDEALIGGVYSFAPLVRRLQRHWPARYELWMLRGADYFTRFDGASASYPQELRHLPHIVGTRGLDREQLDLHMLDQWICVETLPLSSSELRRQFGGRGAGGIDDRLLAYADRHALYRQSTPPSK